MNSANVRDGSLRALARETNIPLETIAVLYDEEVARLTSSARVNRFIPVIAARRVRRRLLHG
jgi:Protein of unknown function (DUF3562)